MKLKFIGSLLILLALFCLVWPAYADKRPVPFTTPAQQQAWNGRTQRFAQLWLQRHKKSVTKPLLKMLADEPTPYLREHIVIALGRIEDPQAVKPLESLLRKSLQSAKHLSSTQQRQEVPTFRIQLALARIQARKLRGTKKLDAIAKSVNRDWAGIVRTAGKLRSQIKERMGIYEVQESEERFVVEEFVDVLYRMGKQRQNIRALDAYQLPFWPQHTAMLQASSLSDRMEVQYWLKRSWPPNSSLFDPAHLLDLGPTVVPELMKYLKATLSLARSNPQTFAKVRSYRDAFNAAATTRNQSFAPILKSFTTVDDRWMKIYAKRALKQLQTGGDSVAFP